MKTFKHFTVEILRQLVTDAHDHLELLRKDKAEEERDTYVPITRYTDLNSVESCMWALGELAELKQRIIEWKMAGQNLVNTDLANQRQFNEIVNLLRTFNIGIALDHNGGIQVG